MAWAEEQYHQYLLKSPAAERARDYLAKRGITSESIARFHLGYAPDEWEWTGQRVEERCRACQDAGCEINYSDLTTNRSYGSFPDGQLLDRQEFYYVTPGTTNNGASAPLAVFINEWQDALIHDVKAYFAQAINKDVYYRHNDPTWSDCDRHNADSHLRSLILGTSLALPVADGDVVLGEWQSIIMAEFDGPRERSIRIQAMGIGEK